MFQPSTGNDSLFSRCVAAVCLALLLRTAISPATASATGFELSDGDRVVLLGDGLIEQEQYHGWVELMMTTSFPDRDVTFRNLGWTGDTPRGDSRFGLSLLQAGREPADEGWRQLQKQLELTEPTLVVLGYGMASSLEAGLEGLPRFIDDYRRLLATARSISPGVRFLFLSPLQRSDEGRLAESHAQALARYAESIERLAEEFESPYVRLTDAARLARHRKNPIHLNDAGYRELAITIAGRLGWDDRSWRAAGAEEAAEALRERILRKNEWWFHRSRPANMAYVFGFRKHEQGQNAAEIPEFDRLVAIEERRIAEMRSLRGEPREFAPPRLESEHAKFVPQPHPEFVMGEGLEVTLFAENPQLNKPIHMNFDPEGRLWVASSEAYPMIEVGQAAPDKILVLEDTTGDGRADRSTVFAEGLLIPTGIAPGDGGVYVAQSTDLLFLKDTDGDGRADVRERVLSGFGTEDTHHNLHTLQWGPDGRLYMNQSVYTRTDTETPRGVVRLKAGGGFRYHTGSQRMQIFFRGLWNSWGHQFDRFGQSFLTDGAGFAGIAYTFPGAAFHPTPGARRQLDLISPGNYPKFCGLEIVGGDRLPTAWQGSIVTCDFRANRVTRFSLRDDGAGFVTRQEPDLMRTSASTFRPIDVKQGPDGALYIADWSNPIINHGEVDFRDERRDRWHGRIWRVTWRGATAGGRPQLRDAGTGELLDNLVDTDRFIRDQSRRVLIERGEAIREPLAAWASRGDDPEKRLQAMWLCQALGLVRDLPLDLLEAADPRVRAAAVRVLGDFTDPGTDQPEAIAWDRARPLYAARVIDDHPRVRLEAVRALALLGTREAGFLALHALARPMDRFLEFALAETVEACVGPLMGAIESGEWAIDSPERQRALAFVLTSIEPSRATRFLSGRLRREPLPTDGSGPWIELIAQAGGQAEIDALWDQVWAGDWTPEATTRALVAFTQAGRLRKLRPGGDLSGLGRWLDAGDADVRRAAIRLAGVWKPPSLAVGLAESAGDETAIDAERIEAIDSLREYGEAALKPLAGLAESVESLAVRGRSIAAIAAIEPPAAFAPLRNLLAAAGTESERIEPWRQVLAVRGFGKRFAEHLGERGDGISEAAAAAGVRACRDGGRDEPELLAVLTPIAGMKIDAERLTPERVQAMIASANDRGDPFRGEQIYLRQELACVNCHAIGGVGGQVGPDMTSLGASAPPDYIIESIFDPDAKIKEGYHSLSVLTEDGLVVTGVESDSTADELVLRDANDRIVRIARDDILEVKPGPSLMPSGVVDRLRPEEQIDLISFLFRLGKPGEFDASRGGVARQFEVFAGTHRAEQEGAERIIRGQVEQGWVPLLTRVNGTVRADRLAAVTAQPRNIALVHVYLRAAFRPGGAGTVTFSAEGGGGAAVWVDGEPLGAVPGADGQWAFAVGNPQQTHTVVVRLDARELPDEFRLRSDDVTFLVP